jgi:hypothetical protein
MPDTFGYYVAAYVVAGILYAGYVVSLVVRSRRVFPKSNVRRPTSDT